MKDRTREIIAEVAPAILIGAFLFVGWIVYLRDLQNGGDLCRHDLSNANTELGSACFWIQSMAQSSFTYIGIVMIPIFFQVISMSFSNRHRLEKLEKEIKELKDRTNV